MLNQVLQACEELKELEEGTRVKLYFTDNEGNTDWSTNQCLMPVIGTREELRYNKSLVSPINGYEITDLDLDEEGDCVILFEENEGDVTLFLEISDSDISTFIEIYNKESAYYTMYMPYKFEILD